MLELLTPTSCMAFLQKVYSDYTFLFHFVKILFDLVSRQAGKQANRQAGKQTSRQVGKQAGKQADKQASKQTSKQAS